MGNELWEAILTFYKAKVSWDIPKLITSVDSRMLQVIRDNEILSVNSNFLLCCTQLVMSSFLRYFFENIIAWLVIGFYLVFKSLNNVTFIFCDDSLKSRFVSILFLLIYSFINVMFRPKTFRKQTYKFKFNSYTSKESYVKYEEILLNDLCW